MGGFQDTRKNQEDIALTPYLFGVWVNRSQFKVFGIGLCWVYYACYIGIGFGIPKTYPYFKIIKKQSHPPGEELKTQI